MNVIVFASRKGGSGKSTLTAHLAAYVHKPSRPCLLVDADPQGSLTLWQSCAAPTSRPLKTASRSVSEIVAAAKRDGVSGCSSIPAEHLAVVEDAVRNATMVIIPARPGVFDVNAVQTPFRPPFGAQALRGGHERRAGAARRLGKPDRDHCARVARQVPRPVWSGQITNRADLLLALAHGEGAQEYYSEGRAASEISGCGPRSTVR